MKDDEEATLKQWTDELCDLQLNHYLIHKSDVRKCPNSECAYAGTVEIDTATERIECLQPLQCP